MNRSIVSSNARMMIIFQVVLLALVWFFADVPFLPQPAGIGRAFVKLLELGLASELATSILTGMEATFYTLVISLTLAYLSRMQFFRTIASLVSKLRFNGLVGLTLFFTLLTSSSHMLKISLLVCTLVVWFTTSLLAEFDAIPQEELDHARTLGMSELRVIYEVVVLGRLDRVVEVIRQNTAIAWVMLTTVEGMVRTEGGIGAMLLNQNKQMKFDEIFVIQITILFLGLFQDWWWGKVRRFCFPYADIETKRR
jgi:NitT/TauT family transport system permease protein